MANENDIRRWEICEREPQVLINCGCGILGCYIHSREVLGWRGKYWNTACAFQRVLDLLMLTREDREKILEALDLPADETTTIDQIVEHIQARKRCAQSVIANLKATIELAENREEMP